MSQIKAAVAAFAPSDVVLTGYDHAHVVTYLRLLDAESEDADWREVARLVLGCDPDNDAECSRRTYDSHLQRARWMSTNGYEHLLRGGPPH